MKINKGVNGRAICVFMKSKSIKIFESGNIWFDKLSSGWS